MLLTGCMAEKQDVLISSAGLELVMLPAGYRAGKYEITQKQYMRVMDNNPSRWQGENRPVENVDWADAVKFCEKLTELDCASGIIPEGLKYSLPSEEQWEYFVEDAGLDDMVYGRWDGLEPLGTLPVGSLGPNKYGLYDVRGNVWEWCRDWWSSACNERVIRGGSWDLVSPEDLEISYRPVSAAVAGEGNLGFRIILIENDEIGDKP